MCSRSILPDHLGHTLEREMQVAKSEGSLKLCGIQFSIPIYIDRVKPLQELATSVQESLRAVEEFHLPVPSLDTQSGSTSVATFFSCALNAEFMQCRRASISSGRKEEELTLRSWTSSGVAIRFAGDELNGKVCFLVSNDRTLSAA